ncbi:MAG: hypothetical protein GC129_01945 [Proteobacteria bacterium]|nr:hypothetical protein [Pseudomonadota bacterium]
MPTATRVSSQEQALSSHLNQTFGYMAGGVGISGIVAWLTTTNATLLEVAMRGNLIWFIAVLVLAFTLQRIVFSLQPAAGLAVFAGFSALMGFALSPLAVIYTGSSIATAFGVAAIMFGGTALYGYFTKRSLAAWGTFLIMGVWGLVGISIVTMLVSLFGVSVGPMNTVINLIAIPLFAGLTAWEVNTIRDTFAMYGRDELLRSRLAILQATSLYINFINIFISLLSLMGQRR